MGILSSERTVVTPAAVVTLAEAKQFLKVDTTETAEEDLIQAEIDSATKFAEDYCSLSLGAYNYLIHTEGICFLVRN